LSREIYESLIKQGISVIIDDRDERAGVKFNDADLTGAPVLVVVGERNVKEGFVELRIKDRNVKERIPVSTLYDRLKEAIDS
ncbi:proline--tRNA ligase, partial [bacterium]|nr:proline--tRNA ligase [bacterium]